MIDIKNYIERKKTGLISIAKLGSGFVLSQKRFSPETGEEIKSVVAGYHLNDIEKIKLELQKLIADADALITNTNNL